MNDFDDLTRPSGDRKALFRPAWFGRLLRAELSLGDTFWIGNIGVALVFVPLVFVVSLLTMLILPLRAQDWVLAGLVAALCLYQIALSRAVWITARRTPEAGGWRWVGVALTLIGILAYAYHAWIHATGGVGALPADGS